MDDGLDSGTGGGPLGGAGDEGGEARRPRTRDRGRDARLVLSGIAAVLLVWFALANLRSVRIDLWVTSARFPLVGVIAISGVLGAALTLLVTRLSRGRRGGAEGE